MHFIPVIVVSKSSRGEKWRKVVALAAFFSCLALFLGTVMQDTGNSAPALGAQDYASSVFPTYRPDSSESMDIQTLQRMLPNDFPKPALKAKSKKTQMYIPVRFNPQATEDDVMKEMIMRWGKIIEAIEKLRRTIACIDRCTNISKISSNVTVEVDGGNETDVNVTILAPCLDSCGIEQNDSAADGQASAKALRGQLLSDLSSALAAQIKLDKGLRSLAHTVVSGRIAPAMAASRFQSLLLTAAAGA
eukprot:CAMPEP_0172182780 /NCGR_PEP_ID=MMETSP1050-20130122/18592_1 /TAXON_ID=233186 /ORGANISM="Cryptomonas curvata, Strain CCAP979/52" /LENGTH=246 /DNA_ID=CAMNT_0012856269 /DNA_START=35 /DNA_END=771 /DNA_ORIENTATION=-